MLGDRLANPQELVRPLAPSSLPAVRTPLVGREEELAVARSLLLRNTVRLLTFTGAAGTGKTRLALQVAADVMQEFPGGVFFVPLASITDASLVAPTVVQSLGARGVGCREPAEVLKDVLRMPGFIDAHRHINTGPNEKGQMQALLEAGYTTVLSGGGPAEGNLTLRDHIEKGVINGPRIIPSGSLRLNNNTPETARAEIRKMAEMGIKFTGEIALTPVPGPSEKELEVLRAIVDEAKKAGVMNSSEDCV